MSSVDDVVMGVGLDAKAAYGFHSLRERKPHLTFGRIINQAWYSYFSCTTGMGVIG
jgi:diacylglycerol kinase (ATP)